MNWKVWQWGRELRELRTLERNRREFQSHVLQVAEENQRLKRALGEAQERLAVVVGRRPRVLRPQEQQRRDLERTLALAELSEDHPVWRAALGILDEAVENEEGAALGPGLGDGQRQFSAGRLACAVDLAGMFRELRWKAMREARPKA